MKFMDKLKDIAKLTDEDYFEEDVNSQPGDYDDYDDGIYSSPAPVDDDRNIYSSSARGAAQPASQPAARASVVGLHSASSPNVVFKKLDRFDDVGQVADELNNKRIVILNLETCPNDVSRRILDFLYGVAYANSGEIKRVAGRAYIITPYNVPVTGELLDEIENSGNY